ncbi:MAG: flagellar biosynthesis protein FlhB [Firmicutes bacterium]|nr:flagellar biosynthesis protein FlhB [Bacillota bacterium]
MKLQRFAERTEPASPRRREQARERGQVSRSPELTSALLLLAGYFSLRYAGPAGYGVLKELTVSTLSHLPTTDWTLDGVHALTLTVLSASAKMLWPVLLTGLIVALSADLAQVGFVFTLQPLAFHLDRLNPISGLQRLFSRRAAADLAKSLLKLLLVGWVVYAALRQQWAMFPTLVDMDLMVALTQIGSLAMTVFLRAALVLLLVAAGDFAYQRWDYAQSLKMTKEEVKQEFKETEGNPQIRGKIRERQRALARRRMLADVPKADVVVTNPSHFAVALKYDAGKMPAPTVVAKGQDYLAQKIKDIAREAGVVVMENKPLARALFASVEVGEPVPGDLYQAVAEVLAFVYRLKGRTGT